MVRHSTTCLHLRSQMWHGKSKFIAALVEWDLIENERRGSMRLMDNVELNMESKVLSQEQTYFTIRVWSKSVLASYKARFTQLIAE